MRGLIIYAALLWATAGARIPSYSTQRNQVISQDLPTTAFNTAATSEPGTLSSSATESSSIVVNNESTTSPSAQETSEIQAIVFPEENSELSVSSLPSANDPPRRRVITYDQRQEGQYNIRADLENFMILMVPQQSSLFSDLLLMKSIKHRPSTSRDKSKGKHTFSVPNFLKYHESVKRVPNSNFNVRSPFSHDEATSGVKPIHVALNEDDRSHARRLPEFIEGRTPYHVDISANDEEQLRLHPDRQVDVLPPPYPLGYQHLKPYHLEAEPTVIQALPPPELQAAHASGSLLETYNHLISSGLKNLSPIEQSSRARQNSGSPELGYYRLSRSIRGSDNALDSDRSNALNSLTSHSSTTRFMELPLYRSEHSMGASSLYPPIDVPRAFGYVSLNGDSPRRSTELQETSDVRDQILDEDPGVGRIVLPPMDIIVPQDDIELELHGVSLLDRAAKTLLSDGMERCAPGQRRDSYGLCREIEGY